MDLAVPAFLIGLVGFIGLHSLRVFAPGWRQGQIARLGDSRFKLLYSVASVLLFLLLIWGYAQARHVAPLFLLPEGMGRGLRHAVALLMLFAFWLLAAAYVPGNHLKAKLKHPMTLAVKVWALAHLLVNHGWPDLLLFGGLLLWAVLVFRAARQRPAPVLAARGSATALTLVLGTAAYALFAFWLHGAWLRVRPFS